MPRFEVCLTTLDCVPAYSAIVTEDAPTKEQAESQALNGVYDDYDWQDDLGRSKPWDEIDSNNVVIAEQ